MNDKNESPAEKARPKAESDAGETRKNESAELPPIPAILPVLPIRGMVVFPGTVMPLHVSREKSKRLIDAVFAGRAYAAYGGVYIAASLLWIWAVEGGRPDRWDLIGGAVCLVGAAVILWGPRAA